MLEYRTLENITYQALFEAFQKSFTQSQTAKESTLESFQDMLHQRKYNPLLSMGAFDSESDTLVSFVLNSKIPGRVEAAYDILTGTLPEYRRQGISKHIFQQIKELLRQHKIRFYKTEVKRENTPAINLYTSVGFKIKNEITTIVHSHTGQRTVEQYEIEMEITC